MQSFEVKRGSGFCCWLVTRTLELRQVNCLVHKHTLQLCAGEHAGDFRKLFGIACYERNPETGHHNIVIQQQCCAFLAALKCARGPPSLHSAHSAKRFEKIENILGVSGSVATQRFSI